tara:strand:- start:43 stop:534 length:492 start_codon:yes stop_codon:yes gene_type:complete
MTAHLNWLSFLQEQDHDVWEYLFNNYILPIIKSRECQKELRYLDNKRLMKLISQATARQYGHRDGACHPGRWFIRYSNLRHWSLSPNDIYCCWNGDKNDKTRCFGEVQFESKSYVNHYNKHDYRYYIKIEGTKDHIMKHLDENEIKYKKSWKKEKLIKAMLSF